MLKYKWRWLGGLIGLVMVAILVISSTFRIAPVSWHWFPYHNMHNELALQGVDVTTYHTTGAPEVGSPFHAYTWQGASWYFVSAENRQLFAKNPERYAPQFGGYCAEAVRSAVTAEIDPAAWVLKGEQLYLFFDQAAKANFVAHLGDGAIATAEKNWATR